MPEEFREPEREPIPGDNGIGFDLGTLDKTGAAAPEPGGKPRKLRKDGQPWGSGSGKRTAASEKVRGTLDLSSLTGLFVGFHVVLAERTGVPELGMTMEEGIGLQKSIENVARHYPINTTQKALDWAALVGTLGMLYGTRFGSYMVRKSAERRPLASVHPIRPAPVQPAPRAAEAAPQNFASDAIIMDQDIEE